MQASVDDLLEGDFERIALIGICGAGKSTLSFWLAEQLNLPLIHLDKEYWQPGWAEPAKAEWNARHAQLIAQERWVMDGNYGGTLSERLEWADFVVFLHFSRIAALRGVLGRVVKTCGVTRADMGENCPERFDFSFLKYVWKFNDGQLRRILEKLTANPELPVLVLRSRAEVNQLMGKKNAVKR